MFGLGCNHLQLHGGKQGSPGSLCLEQVQRKHSAHSLAQQVLSISKDGDAMQPVPGHDHLHCTNVFLTWSQNFPCSNLYLLPLLQYMYLMPLKAIFFNAQNKFHHSFSEGCDAVRPFTVQASKNLLRSPSHLLWHYRHEEELLWNPLPKRKATVTGDWSNSHAEGPLDVWAGCWWKMGHSEVNGVILLLSGAVLVLCIHGIVLLLRAVNQKPLLVCRPTHSAVTKGKVILTADVLDHIKVPHRKSAWHQLSWAWAEELSMPEEHCHMNNTSI